MGNQYITSILKVKKKEKKHQIMPKQFLSLLLVFLSLDCIFAQPTRDNNTIPDDFKCPDNDIEHFFPDPKNCAKYYQCWHGLATHSICPSKNGEQLMYLGDSVCDWEHRVDCGDRPICDINDDNCHGGSKTTPEPSITTTQKPPKPTLCRNVKCEGSQFYPEGACNQCFCQCDPYAIAHEICCPAGLVFNSFSNLCDWPINVEGC